MTPLDPLMEQDKICLKYGLSPAKLKKETHVFPTDVLVARCKIIKKYIKELERLKKLPFAPQKSDLWYKMRENIITASDFGQAVGFGQYGNLTELIMKKCEPVDEAKFDNPAFKWGNIFESIAVSIYEKIMGVTIHEFGLVQHPKLDWFGASPDGISNLGTMLEIKCPYRRRLDGDIIKQYYYQMQGQLDTCDLEECDYIEARIWPYKSYEHFIDNIENGDIKGIFIENLDEDPKWIYSQISYADTQLRKDYFDSFIKEHQKPTSEVIYWYVEKINLLRVKRDRQFFAEEIRKLEEFWNRVKEYRINPDKYNYEVKNSITFNTVPFIGHSKKKEVKKADFMDNEEDDLF